MYYSEAEASSGLSSNFGDMVEKLAGYHNTNNPGEDSVISLLDYREDKEGRRLNVQSRVSKLRVIRKALCKCSQRTNIVLSSFFCESRLYGKHGVFARWNQTWASDRLERLREEYKAVGELIGLIPLAKRMQIKVEREPLEALIKEALAEYTERRADT